MPSNVVGLLFNIKSRTQLVHVTLKMPKRSFETEYILAGTLELFTCVKPNEICSLGSCKAESAVSLLSFKRESEKRTSLELDTLRLHMEIIAGFYMRPRSSPCWSFEVNLKGHRNASLSIWNANWAWRFYAWPENLRPFRQNVFSLSNMRGLWRLPKKERESRL